MTSTATAATTPQIEVVDEVASVLRERIFAGRYLSGDPLGQERVAADLGIGRTPIREALRQLEQECLVEIDARGALRVVESDVDRLAAAYEARTVFDGLSAQLAASRPDRGNWLPYLDRLLVAGHGAASASDGRALAQAIADFHVALAYMSENKFLIAQVGLIRLTVQVLDSFDDLDPASAANCVQECEAIRDAIDQGSPDGAEVAARAHAACRIARIRDARTRPTGHSPTS